MGEFNIEKSAEVGQWLSDNVKAPGYNTLVVQPVNAVANVVNGVTSKIVGKDVLPKLELEQYQPAEMFTKEWYAQEISSGLANAAVYAVVGKAVGGTVRGLGGAIKLEGTVTRFAASEHTAQILGAALFDGARDKQQGETRFGNALASAGSFMVFEGGNRLAKSMPLMPGIVSKLAIGAAGSAAQAIISSGVSEHSIDALLKLDLKKHMLSGGVMNLVLPTVQERILGRALDQANVELGRGVLVNRYENYAARNKLHGLGAGITESESPTLYAQKRQHPLARVQPDAVTLVEHKGAGRIHVDTEEKLRPQLEHELGHLDNRKLAEPMYKQAAEALQMRDEAGAWDKYRQTRLEEEKRSIAKETGGNEQARHLTDMEIAQAMTPMGVTYEQLWRNEFEEFKKSNGKHRPKVDFAPVGEDETIKELRTCLLDGRISDAKNIIELNQLTADDLKDTVCYSAHFGLAYCLASGRIDEAQKLIKLKLLTNDQIHDAANSSLKTCLSVGTIDNAKKILALKLLTEDDLKAVPIRDAARSKIAEYIQTGRTKYYAKKVIDLNLISDVDLKADKTIRDAASSRLATFLASGELDEAKAVIGFGLLSDDDLHSAPIRDAARFKIAEYIQTGRTKYAKEVIDLNLISDVDLKADKTIRDAASSGLATSLASGELDEAKAVIGFGLLSDDDLHSAPIRAAASSGFAECISRGWRSAKKILDLKLLTEDDLRADVIRNAASSRLAHSLSDVSASSMNEVKTIISFNVLTAGDLKSDPIRNAASSGLAKCLSEGRIDTAQEVFNLNLLTAEDLKTDEICNAAYDGLTMCLSKGEIESAKKIIDLKLLTEDGLKTDAIREATSSGIAICLFEGRIDRAKEVIDLKLLTDDQVQESARSGLVTCLSEGRIDNAKEVIDLKLLTADDFKADAIREAARSGLVACLSEGRIDNAKKVIDLKLLTVDDLKADSICYGARSGLTTCLSKGWIDRAKEVIDFKLIDQSVIDDCFRQSVQQGHITSVVQTALSTGIDLDTTLEHYLSISKLTDERATMLFEDLKKLDNAWQDVDNIQRPFEEGAAVFGAERMLRYAFKANASPHDALFAFHDVVQLFKGSGLSEEQFYGNVLMQVNRDDAVNDVGSSFTRLNAIARDFPDNIGTVLDKARNYPDIETLQELLASFSDHQSVFASWTKLQRFAKLYRFVSQTELLPEIQQLRRDKPKLGAWVEALIFHPDSRVASQAVIDFWKNPGRFIDRAEQHAPEVHSLKKPSHYTDIPHLDLSATELRDALVEGTLDRLQVFQPMKVEYEVGGTELNLTSELDRALGSRRDSRTGAAKNPRKLFSEVNKLLQDSNLNVAQMLDGAELSPELKTQLEALLYNEDIGVVRPQSTGLHLVAEIHRKGDPIAVVAGDDAVSCMGFGTGKNNVYMFNPNDALFTVRLVRPDGTARTIAESVLTKDRDVKVPVPVIIEKMKGTDRATLHTIFPEASLRSEKSVVAADNVEVNSNYTSDAYQAAYEAVYRDFFARYTKLHGESQNLRDDKLVIGLGHSDAMQSLPTEPNTYVPQAPLGYSDKTHKDVLALSLTDPQKVPIRVLNVEGAKEADSVEPPVSTIRGIKPLTFEDTLSVAYLEGKVFQDAPSLIVGLHNIENALIAKDINNTAKERPNLSLQYTDNEGRMRGYMLAYEGKKSLGGAEQPVVYIGDFTSDRTIGPSGKAQPGVVGGKLLLEFGRLYKEHYLDKGNMVPIYANARDNTSYELLMKQNPVTKAYTNLEALGRRLGYRFEVQEIGSHQADSSTMHNVLIVPHKLAEAS